MDPYYKITRELLWSPRRLQRWKGSKKRGGYGCNSRPVRKVQNFGSALLHFYTCHLFNIVSAAEGSAMLRATAMRCNPVVFTAYVLRDDGRCTQ
jgi:hypothetical protein